MGGVVGVLDAELRAVRLSVFIFVFSLSFMSPVSFQETYNFAKHRDQRLADEMECCVLR